MSGIAIFGDKSLDSSVGQMAAAFAAALESAGHHPVVTSDPAEAIKADLCVNLMMRQAHRLHKAQRFGRCRHFIQWYAQNPENFEDYEVATHLMVAAQGKLVVQSAHLQSMLNDYMRRVFSAAYIKRVYEATLRIDYGVSDAFRWSENNDPDKFVAPFNRVNETFKRFSMHRTITETVKQSLALRGHATEHHFVRAKDMGMAGLPESHPYLVRDQPAREVYEAEAGTYGFFISTSRSESYGLYYVELLLSGVVGLFLTAPWVRALLPDYPFVFESRKELTQAAIALHGNYAEARRLLRDYLEGRESRYRASTFHSTMIKVIERELA